MRKSLHYWRIHSRVCRRLWTDIPERTRHVIANDANHETEDFKWFEKKVAEDTQRLYEDSNYYDNSEFTFRVPKVEPVK